MDLMMLVPTSEDQLNAEENLEAPCTEHQCKIPPEWDELKNVIEGNGICAKARRAFRRQCLVSTEHPETRFWLKGKAAISYEYIRHATSYIYMVHPFSRFRIYWESLMYMTTVLALIIIPFRFTFYFEFPSGEWFFLIATLNSFFLIDIVLSFFTGHHDLRTNVVILEPRIIARKYITGWFLFDLLSSLPVELLPFFVNETPMNVELYCYFQVLKIFRLRTIVLYGRRLRRVYNISFQMHKYLEIMIVMVIVLHWAACIEFYASMSVYRSKARSGMRHSNWASQKISRGAPIYSKYAISLHRAVTALACSLKYGDISVAEDLIIDAALSIFGRIANIYLIAQWFQLMNTFRATNSSYLRLLPQLHEFMRQKELPSEIRNRLTTYYKYCTQRGIDLERNIMSQVSAQLREELMLHCYRRLVERMSFFKYLPNSAVTRIVMSLHTEVFLTHDVIIKAGTTGDTMFFIASGTVALYTSLGKEICHLEDGAHFGEISLIMENEPRVASVVAVGICELYALSREDFQQAIEPYPNLMNILQKLALERLEKSLVLGDIYRYEGNIPESLKKNPPKSDDKQKNKNWDYLYLSLFIHDRCIIIHTINNGRIFSLSQRIHIFC